MAGGGGFPEGGGRDVRLAADDEQRPAHGQGGEEVAEALDGDLGHRAQGAVVEAQGKPVNGGVTAEPVQIDRDGPDHGIRRDSS